MNQVKKLSVAVAGACALLGASAANAGIGFRAGAWDVDFSGNINAFYVNQSCDDTTTVVAGGLACGSDFDPVAIRSGLLPSALVISAKTNQANFDIGVTVGFYPGINSTDPTAAPPGTGANANQGGAPRALGTSGIDLRQNFLTFGQSWGTLKLGRDLGLFGSDAILSDMTLLGVGSPSPGNATPGNTSLGRIGLGYIYADWIPQITYISPKIGGGFQVSAGIFQPFNIVAPVTQNEDLGYQAKVTWDFAGPVTGRLWAGFFQQDNELIGGGSFDGKAYDVGAKIGFGPAELVGYYYDGDGVGTTGLFVLALDALGNERDSDGGYLQGTVKFGPTKLGLSWGVSNLDTASGEVNPTLVESNESIVFGVYHALTSSVNLVFEYIKTESENQDGGDIEDDAFAVGAILFF